MRKAGDAICLGWETKRPSSGKKIMQKVSPWQGPDIQQLLAIIGVHLWQAKTCNTYRLYNFVYMGVSNNRGPQGGWFVLENPSKMDDCGALYFWKHPYIYTLYIWQYQYKNPTHQSSTHQDSPWDSIRPSCDWVCWHPTVIPAPSRDLGKSHGDLKRLSGFPRQRCGDFPLVGQPKNS